MNLLQLRQGTSGRRVGIVKNSDVILLDKRVVSSYQLFQEIINEKKALDQATNYLTTKEVISYDDVYYSKNGWQILVPIDCPSDPMLCMLSGTGLTHKASAENRQKMHESQKVDHLTDSMKMYMWGEEGGKPEANTIGVQPEWFYKGNGYNLKGHLEPLIVPNYADDGGEEPEVAGIYLISEEGIPHRLGFAQANEFSDHVMEKKNYLYLAHSKIRNCSIGPELVTNESFQSLTGEVKIIRGGEVFWSKSIHSGEQVMAHSLANLEHHHFKYAQHRLPGQLHIHFFGASAFSFANNIKLQHEDEMSVSFKDMGRPLINPLHIDRNKEQLQEIKSL